MMKSWKDERYERNNNWHINQTGHIQGRIQEFILGGAKPRSPLESWGRSPSRGREAPEELRAKPEPRAKPEKKRGEGSGEGARWAPPQKIFENQTWNHSFLVHIWSNYLKWLTKWFNCKLSWKIISNYLMWRKKRERGLGRGLGELLPRKFFGKIKLETIHFGAYLKQLFEMTITKWYNCHFHEKSLVIILCDGIWILLGYKIW